MDDTFFFYKKKFKKMTNDEILDRITDKVRILIDEFNSSKRNCKLSIDRDIRGESSIMIRLIIVAEDQNSLAEVTKYFSDNSLTLVYLNWPNNPGHFIVLKNEEIEKIINGENKKQLINSVVKNPDCYILATKLIILLVLIYVLYEIFKRQ